MILYHSWRSCSTPEVLLERMSDPNCDVREEALVALANRKESRAVPALIAELNQREISDRLREAAETFLGENEQRLGWVRTISPGRFGSNLRCEAALTPSG